MAETTTVSEPVFPKAKLNLVKPKDPCLGRVTASRLCMNGKSASFVRHVDIDVSGTPLAGNFLAGQSFGVLPPGERDDGKPHPVRLYSIACPSWGEDGQGNIVSTTPKRLIDERRPQKDGDDPDDHRLFLGVTSNYLCDLRVGDEVKLTGPAGKRFLLPSNPADHDYLFIATGTGIAPFRGMAMELLEHPDGPTDSQIHLVMGAPYHTDLLYHDLFSHYQNQFDNFEYDVAISRESRGTGKPGLYVDRLIDQQIDRFRELLSSPRTLLYICGLEGMQIGVFTCLATHGLHAGYVNVTGELEDVDPKDWQPQQIKRYVRPTARCMIEVY